MENFEVDIDEELDIIYYKITGSVDSKEEANKIGEEIINKVNTRLPNEWYAINDIREMGVISPEASDILDNNQEKLDNMGAQAVVRVISDETAEVTKMSFEVGANYEYDVYQAGSVQQAKEKIDEIRGN